MSKSKKIRRKIRYSILYHSVKSLISLSHRMSRIGWLKFCGHLGGLAYYLVTKSRRLVITHLTKAYPALNEKQVIRMARNVFNMLGKNAGEMLRASRVQNLSELSSFLETTGLENYEVAIAKGKGVIFLTCHLGAFDLQVSNMALRGLNPNIIGTPLKDERLTELLWDYRNKYGAIAIARGKETFRLIKVLKSNGSVALLIDQDTRVKSRFVNFFGRPAATPVGATVLAMKTGAAVVPTYIYLGTDWKQHMCILPEIPMRLTADEDGDVIYNTQILTNFIEDTIRQHPEQWLWMHERWKTKPGEEIQ